MTVSIEDSAGIRSVPAAEAFPGVLKSAKQDQRQPCKAADCQKHGEPNDEGDCPSLICCRLMQIDQLHSGLPAERDSGAVSESTQRFHLAIDISRLCPGFLKQLPLLSVIFEPALQFIDAVFPQQQHVSTV